MTRVIAGRASVIQEFPRAGLLDEVHVHIVPIFMGSGVRLFDRPDSRRVGLEPVRASGSSAVSNLECCVVR